MWEYHILKFKKREGGRGEGAGGEEEEKLCTQKK